MENSSFKEIKDEIAKVKSNYSLDKENSALSLIETLKGDKRKNVVTAALGLLRYIEKHNAEILRVTTLYEFDMSFRHNYIAGCDEVGRGPLAGPIVAASVILDPRSLKNKDIILGINDSKKLSISLRQELSEIIKSKALSVNIFELSNKEIDKKGIAWCNNEVLKNASENLSVKPDFIISDGYPIKGTAIKNQFVIKGDSKSAAVACASIIAKVYRDNLMISYSKIYKNYGFENNAGYGTAEHLEGIRKYGVTDIHRMSFLNNILKGQ